MRVSVPSNRGVPLCEPKLTTRPFQKPATTYPQQVALLQSRGMKISDTAKAEFYLQHINYYRLCAYWLPYEQDHATHTFKPGTNFDTVLSAYSADRRLRLLFLDAIERIEVSVRCHWAYELAHRHGPHGYLDPALAKQPDYFQKNIEKLRDEVDRSDEVFIEHIRTTYSEPLPPVWAAAEVMSLGLLSSWYNNLKPSSTRVAIASAYQVDDSVLSSWLHHLTFVRNICAHHSRLWNRRFVLTPQLPRTKPAGLGRQFVPGSRKIYNTMVLTLHLMGIIAPGSTWKQHLITHLLSGDLDLKSMDFPKDWQTAPIWATGE